MFVMLVVLLAGFAVSDRWLLQNANSRDLARVYRYGRFSRLLLEAWMNDTPPDVAIERLRKLGVDRVDWLPPNAAPQGKSPRLLVPGSSFEAWEPVKDHSGATLGYVRITQLQGTSHLMLGAVRWFTAFTVLGYAAVLIAVWLGINHTISKRLGSLARQLGGNMDAIASEPLEAVESAVDKKISDLQGQLAQAQLMLERHSEGACLCTTDGHILEATPSFCRMLGRTHDELVGTNRLDLVPGTERTDALENLKRLGRRTPESTTVHRITLPQGATRWIRCRDTAVFGHGDTVEEVLSFALDITHEKQLADEIAAMRGAFDQTQSLGATGSLTWDLTRDEMRWTAETFHLLALDPSSAHPCLDKLLDTVVTTDRGPLRQLLQNAKATGTAFEYEFRVLLPDGSLRFLQSRAEVRTDPHTKLLDQLTCTLRDVTALRDAETATRRSLHFREAIEQSLGCGIVVMDPEGRILSVNLPFCTMTGYQENVLVGLKPPFPFWPDDEKPAISNAFNLMLEGKAPREGFQFSFVRKNGTRFDVLINVAPLMHGKNRQLGWLATLTDISEMQATRRALLETNQRLAAALERCSSNRPEKSGSP